MSALALLAVGLACMGAPVQRTPTGSLVVRAGPFVGAVTAYDARRGRFVLRAGGYRARGLSQKIPWFPASGAATGDSLTVSGRSLSLPPRTFTQTFTAAREVGGAQRTMFPTIISPPARGCWLLTFTSGSATASIPVTVLPRIRG